MADERQLQRLETEVRQDVEDGLATKGLFADAEGAEEDPFRVLQETVDEASSPIPLRFLDDEVGSGVVAWEIQVEHRGRFEGIPPTGRTLQVRGSTHVIGLRSDQDATFVRFVDWASVLAQLGVTFNTKPLVAEAELLSEDKEEPLAEPPD